jgi:hypothetical protein
MNSKDNSTAMMNARRSDRGMPPAPKMLDEEATARMGTSRAADPMPRPGLLMAGRPKSKSVVFPGMLTADRLARMTFREGHLASNLTPPANEDVSTRALVTGVPPVLEGQWTWFDTADSGFESRVRELQMVFAASGSGSMRFAIKTTQFQTDCVETDVWNWFQGTWAVSSQQLVLTVTGGQMVQAFSCEPWRNNQSSIPGVIYIPGWRIAGTASRPTLVINPPAVWNVGVQTLTLNKVAGAPETWSAYESLGGSCWDGVALASWAPGRLDLFTVGSDAAMYHQFYIGTTWSGWVDYLGGDCISAAAAVSRSPNLIDLFVIGSDHAMYQQWFDGTNWSGWARNLGGYCLYGGAAASWAANRLDLFTTAGDGAVYQKSWDGTAWGDWQSLGGFAISAPAAVSAAANTIDLFVLGADHQLYHNHFSNSVWSGWFPLGGYCLYGVSVSSRGPLSVDAFVVGGDSAIYQKTFDGVAWDDFVDLGGGCISPPTSVSWAANRIDLCVIGGDHATYHKAWA